MHPGHVLADRGEDGQQPPGGQHQRIAVGQKDAPHALAEARRGRADGLEHLLLAAGAKGLLRRGIHLAEGAFVPGAAVGHRQDQRLRLAGRAEHGFDVADRDVHRAGLGMAVGSPDSGGTPRSTQVGAQGRWHTWGLSSQPLVQGHDQQRRTTGFHGATCGSTCGCAAAPTGTAWGEHAAPARHATRCSHFEIPGMDCPSEERLIRMQLADCASHFDFDLPRAVSRSGTAARPRRCWTGSRRWASAPACWPARRSAQRRPPALPRSTPKDAPWYGCWQSMR